MNYFHNDNNHVRENGEVGQEEPGFEEMYDAWENHEAYSHQYKKPDLAKIWERIKSLLGWDQEKADRRLSHKVLKYAAVILFPIVAFAAGLYLSDGFLDGPPDDMVVVSTGPGVSTRVNLPDGSSIWLRPGSNLSYPDEFDYDSRNLQLEGKAFFSVQTDPDWPFVVSVGSLDAVATGTKFTLDARTGQDRVKAGLISGNVQLRWCEADDKQRVQNMQPMEVLVFSCESRSIVDKQQLSPKVARWNQYNLAFDGAPFSEVIHELAAWYNVHIEIEDQLPRDKPITMTVREESLHEIMDILQVIVGFEYTFSRNQLTISDS